MKLEDNFDHFLAERTALKENARSVAPWRSALPLNHKKARFPGFHQRTVNYTAGQQVESGCLPLPIDVTMHESVPMLLRDKTKLYCDIFVPAHYQDLSKPPQKRLPAIVAWYEAARRPLAFQTKSKLMMRL